MRLNGKTAIVTGAASGFGAGIARKFAAEGAQVMVVDINHDGAMGMAAELGNGAFGHVCNVADGAQVQALINAGSLFAVLQVLARAIRRHAHISREQRDINFRRDERGTDLAAFLLQFRVKRQDSSSLS